MSSWLCFVVSVLIILHTSADIDCLQKDCIIDCNDIECSSAIINATAANKFNINCDTHQNCSNTHIYLQDVTDAQINCNGIR